MAIIILKLLTLNFIKRHACSDIFLINEKDLLESQGKVTIWRRDSWDFSV